MHLSIRNLSYLHYSLFQVTSVQACVCTRRHSHTQCMYVNAEHSPYFSQNGSTSLMLAAVRGHVEVVRMLVNEFSCSLDEVNNVSVYTVARNNHYMVKHAFQ